MRENQNRYLPVARGLGRVIGEVAARADIATQRISKLGGTLFQMVNMLSPLSTNTFTVSDRFKKLKQTYQADNTAEVIEAAVRKSKLPEGIHIAHPRDENPPKPFVVLTNNLSEREAAESHRRGAIIYRSMTWDVDKLAARLDEDRSYTGYKKRQEK